VPTTSLLNDPAHWHARAKEARQIANQLNDAVVRSAMLRIAQGYDMMATNAERRNAEKGGPTLVPDVDLD
jgi:hypothetical protein